MTDDYTSSYPQPGSGTSDGGASTADTAKEQASNLKQTATGAGGHLLGEAKGEAAAVTQEARRQLSDLWSQARTEVSGQASTQQTRIAGGLSAVGNQFSQMASAPDQQNLATDIVREVGDRVEGLGRWLENHGPDEVLDEVRSFARRRPGTFLLVAAGAGVVLGRLTRGLKDGSTSSSGSTPSTTTAPQSAPVTESAPVYTGLVEERPVYADELTAPVASTAGWEQR